RSCLMSSPSADAFVSYCYDDHRDLHSFPTRRSSDLVHHADDPVDELGVVARGDELVPAQVGAHVVVEQRVEDVVFGQAVGVQLRSEEHTSELQSREKLVCRLLLEKKKDNRETRIE